MDWDEARDNFALEINAKNFDSYIYQDPELGKLAHIFPSLRGWL